MSMFHISIRVNAISFKKIHHANSPTEKHEEYIVYVYTLAVPEPKIREYKIIRIHAKYSVRSGLSKE